MKTKRRAFKKDETKDETAHIISFYIMFFNCFSPVQSFLYYIILFVVNYQIRGE